MTTFLAPGAVSLDTLRTLMTGGRIALPPGAGAAIDASAASVAAIAAHDDPVYGINTGFGKLAKLRIAPADLAELQRRLIVSHCVGVGDPLPDPVVRLILAIKINSLARGHSGVRASVIDALIALYNADVLPIVPAKGSVGASGDLAPLAHLSAALIGCGKFRRHGVEISSDEAFARAGVAPVVLGPKEGLALINGSQVSTALALAGLFAIENVFAGAIMAGALSVDAAAGSDVPFIPEIQAVRGHPGQIAVAKALSALLAGSAIRASHVAGDDRVQDPYSLRCQPQVMGAVLDLMGYATETLAREANAVSDNPLVFGARVVSGGNFHAEPVAFAADMLAMAVAEIGSLSERRTSLLVDPALSGLPAFLVAEPGLNSGFMIAQVTAAALVAENKMLCHPASVDSLPTSANQEDHVSMATHGARRTLEMARNAADVIAIELLAAAQGIDMRKPLTTAPALAEAMGMIRARSAFLSQDRALADDMAKVRELVEAGWFRSKIPLQFASSRESASR